MEPTGARPEGLDPAQQLRELERAEALPYVVYPDTPRWYPPVMGLTYGAIVVFFGTMYGDDVNRVLFMASAVVLAGGLGALLGFVKVRYGAFPRPFGAGTPPEIRDVYRRYLVGAAIVVGLVALVWWWAGPLVAAAVTVVVVTAGLALYEVVYAREAARARTRLGIDERGAA